MGAISTIAMLVIFPLNSLLVFNGDWAVGKEQRLQLTNEISQGAEVKGVEKAKEDEIEEIGDRNAPKPIMKEDANDLTITNAHSSLILDANSGTILHYGNAKQQRQIASLTKIMTAVLTMENVKDLDELVTIDEEPVYVEGTKIGCPRSGYCISQRLKVGEQISVRNLLKAMLMNSANDAAIALGKHISGSQEKFAELMNARAKKMGLTDSHFCTPSGLEIDGRENECYSSAYDIGRIAAYSLKFDFIWNTFRLPNDTVITSADGKIEHHILNTDLVMDQIPNLLGGKTGFTPLAGRSLLMVATDPTGNHKIVSVLLDDPYRWQDIKTMFSWAFKSYTWN